MSYVLTGPLDQIVRSVLARAVTFELRLLLTVGIAAITALIAFLAAPYAVRATDEFFQELTTEESTARSFVPPRLVLRSVQSLTLFAAGLVLLLIWGYVSLASALASLFVAAAPLAIKVIGTIALIVALVITVDLAKRRIRGLSEETERIGEHEESVLMRVTHLVILLSAFLATLSLWDFNIANLLIGAGFLGIVVGMGARQVLAAGISGFVLMFSRPFEVGDWVEIGDVQGTVMDISIMHTHLRSFDGESIVVPNDEIERSTVINRTDRGRLRLEVDVGVGYDTDIDEARDVALEAIESVDDVLEIPSPQVMGTEFDDYAITLRLRFWIENPSMRRKWRTRSAVITSVKGAFDAEGIEIPFPHREISGTESLVEAPQAAE